MLLTTLVDELPGARIVAATAADPEIVRVDHDSRAVVPGSLFCCVSGRTVDGHDFAPAAIQRGAVAVLVDRDLDRDLGVPAIRVGDTRHAMAGAAAAVSGHPSSAMAVIGVTGTNGKTTTTLLVAAIMHEADRSVAVSGTLSGARTTPEAPELQRWLANRRREGVAVIAMEVSSHALAQRRVDGTHFVVAGFTNLSPEHLDFHATMEEYFAAKARLFTSEFAEIAVINVDDPYGRRLAASTTLRVHPVSLSDLDDGAAPIVTPTGMRFIWHGHTVELALGGRFNVTNALVAAESARVLGIDDVTICRGLSRPVVVPGRFERVDAGQPFTVVVDFAHTPDALTRVLEAASEMAGSHRVHVVFGCGGDRDPRKRPTMGEAAAMGADRVVLTADNSRDEPTGVIIDAVRAGFDGVGNRRAVDLVVEPDRSAAIALALAAGGVGDVVVIAGKGHETTQDLGGVVSGFDDRIEARRALAALGWGAAS